MVVLTQRQRLIMFMARGRFGYTRDDRLGLRTYEQALATNAYAGIYQNPVINGKRHYRRMRFYKPTNNRMPKQQAWRAVFAEACAQYKLLPNEEKEYFERWGYKYRISGWNKFISEFMKAHKFSYYL